jgi:acyl-CoA thioesterase FadM
MKITAPTLDQIHQLERQYSVTVPPEWRDDNNHMNMRYYLATFDEAGYPLYAYMGITPEVMAEAQAGGFDLEHHIWYLNEVRIGDTIHVHTRVLRRTEKRMHYIMLMVNETRGVVAAVFECVNSHANLALRRTAPWPPAIAAKLDTLIAQHNALDWEAPISGVISA